jgi:hypothetical protein
MQVRFLPRAHERSEWLEKSQLLGFVQELKEVSLSKFYEIETYPRR